MPNLRDKPKNNADLTNMSMGRLIWKVAIPATLIYMLNTVFGLIDAYFVGKLGAEDMAALSSGSVIMWILYSVGSLGAVGAQTLVSQGTGAGKPEFVRRSVIAALMVHAILGAVVLVPLYFAQPAIFGAMGLEPGVALKARQFLSPIIFGMFFYFLGMVLNSAFYGTGDAKTPAIVISLSLLVNAVIDPFLILGFAGAPKLGLLGAGIATASAKLFGVALIFYFAFRKGLIDLKFLAPLKETLKLAKSVVIVGSPIAANGVIFSGVYLGLIKILSSFGSTPIATLGVAHRIEGLAWFTCVGFSVACAALAGQLVGAGRNRDAVVKVWKMAEYLVLILGVISLALMLFGERITTAFIDDPAVAREGGRYLFAIGVFEVFLGLEVVYEACLGVVGSSHLAFFIATPLTLLRIPLGWLFGVALGFGTGGVWWVISFTTLLKGALLALGYSFGSWRKKKSLVERLDSAAKPGA